MFRAIDGFFSDLRHGARKAFGAVWLKIKRQKLGFINIWKPHPLIGGGRNAPLSQFFFRLGPVDDFEEGPPYLCLKMRPRTLFSLYCGVRVPKSVQALYWRWQVFKKNAPEKFWMWLAWKLPRPLAYFAAIRVIAEATSALPDTAVPELLAMDAIKSWEK